MKKDEKMKKLIILIGLCGVILFGGELQSTQSSVNSAKLKEAFKNATKLEFIKKRPAQIAINVPVNIEDVISGIQDLTSTDTYTDSTTVQRLGCLIYEDTLDNSNRYTSHSDTLKGGDYIVSISFNNIPKNKLIKLNKYWCAINYSSKNAEFAHLGNFGSDLFEVKNFVSSGSF